MDRFGCLKIGREDVFKHVLHLTVPTNLPEIIVEVYACYDLAFVKKPNYDDFISDLHVESVGLVALECTDIVVVTALLRNDAVPFLLASILHSLGVFATPLHPAVRKNGVVCVNERCFSFDLLPEMAHSVNGRREQVTIPDAALFIPVHHFS